MKDLLAKLEAYRTEAEDCALISRQAVDMKKKAYFAKLAWTSWTPGLASAKGALVLNDCTPYCAAGHFHRYPAIVVLWGSKAVPGHPGERCYTKLTEILTGQRPRYYDAVHHKWVTAPMTQTMPLLTSSHEA